MAMKFLGGISLFLFTFVAFNIFFYYNLNSVSNIPVSANTQKLDIAENVEKEIHDYLASLPNQYYVKNPKFMTVQGSLIHLYNSTGTANLKSLWNTVAKWADNESLFPNLDGAPGQILQAMQTSNIVLIDNAPKGTQLKLLLLLEGKQKLLFKPMRYDLANVISGHVYAGFDRHNSEIFAYYLGMVLNFRWIAPAITRKISMDRQILPVATLGLKSSMVKNESGSMCIYGKCYYCKVNETVCPDNKGEIEGAAILYLDKQFKINKSPWRRSYTTKKMDWEIDNDFCKKVSLTLSSRRILNLVDIAIFDYLIQNGDRHRYETFKNKIVFLDNGKGLGNPTVDVLDILAPLYQCCMITLSTWQNLELVSGGSLTETIKLLSSFRGEILTTEDHYVAVERRLLTVYATVQYCIRKYGIDKVIKNSVT